MSNAEWARQFSSPASDVDSRLREVIVGTFFRAAALELVSAHRPSIESATSGVVDAIKDWSESPPTFETTWHLAFGRSYVALTTGVAERYVVEAATQLALRMAEVGVVGTWQSDCTPHRVQVGNLVVDGVDRISAEVTSSSRRIKVSGDQTVRLDWNLDDKRWESDRVGLPDVGLSRPVYLLDAASVPLDDADPPFCKIEPIEAIGKDVCDRFTQALQLIRRLGYLPWIEGVLRSVLVCARTEETESISGSSADWPGIVQMAPPASAPAIAESLVHECAHQYFMMLALVGAVDDGSDTESYWSPPVRAVRPIRKILLAYHAFANVLILFKDMLRLGMDNSRYAELNLPAIQHYVTELDKPLRDNRALTDLGRALYDPLAARLDKLSDIAIV